MRRISAASRFAARQPKTLGGAGRVRGPRKEGLI